MIERAVKVLQYTKDCMRVDETGLEPYQSCFVLREELQVVISTLPLDIDVIDNTVDDIKKKWGEVQKARQKAIGRDALWRYCQDQPEFEMILGHLDFLVNMGVITQSTADAEFAVVQRKVLDL